MRVVHVVASIDDEAAGPSVSAPRLAEAQARAGAQASLSTVAGWKKGHASQISVPHTRYEPSFPDVPVLRNLAASHAMRQALLDQAHSADVLHTHGLWLMPNVYPAAAAKRRGATFVISPRGMLAGAALRFSATKKHIFWALAQKRAAESAALFHATSEQEALDIRAMGLTAPIVVAANGVDLPDLPEAAPPDASLRTILYLGRVHPKKGLEHLMRAWAEVEASAAAWRLRIVGPSELGHADDLRVLAAQLGIQRIVIEGPLYGAEKTAAYRDASLFVLPSLNENFAMTVAESLAAGTPVISTRGAPWAGLERERCGWWVDCGPAALAEALRLAVSLPGEMLAAMGARGRAWMARDFSWDRTARVVLDAYMWVKGDGPKPSAIAD
jgi:glycosyltransferase involved in cell wall biosynthesis